MAQRTPSTAQRATARTSIANATVPMKSLNFMDGRMTGHRHGEDAASRRLQVRLPLRVQVGENGEHAAVILRRGGEAKLREDARHVLLDRALGDDELLGDP